MQSAKITVAPILQRNSNPHFICSKFISIIELTKRASYPKARQQNVKQLAHSPQRPLLVCRSFQSKKNIQLDHPFSLWWDVFKSKHQLNHRMCYSYLMWIIVPWEPGDTRAMVTPKDRIRQYMHMKQKKRVAILVHGRSNLITRDNGMFATCILSSISPVHRQKKSTGTKGE